jgi:hypothetical protein
MNSVRLSIDDTTRLTADATDATTEFACPVADIPTVSNLFDVI